MNEDVPPGTRVMYWGKVQKWYGKELTVRYKNVCNCKHQTYALTTPEGDELSKVLSSSFTVIED